MNYIDLIQYKVQNSENTEAIKWAKMTLSTAHSDGFKNVYDCWFERLNEMVILDKNGYSVNKDYIEDAKYDRNKMIEIIYSKL